MERTKEEVVKDIKDVLQKFVAPVVDQHGGVVNYVDFDNGVLKLEMVVLVAHRLYSTE